MYLYLNMVTITIHFYSMVNTIQMVISEWITINYKQF